jgi:hypothetical protein
MHAGYVTQIRNSEGQNGYVCYDDTLTHAPGVADGSVYLARIDPTVYPYSQAVYIDTKMDSHINPRAGAQQRRLHGRDPRAVLGVRVALRVPRCEAAQRAGTTASIGTASFPLPHTHGVYQARYYVHGHVTAVSAPFSPATSPRRRP